MDPKTLVYALEWMAANKIKDEPMRKKLSRRAGIRRVKGKWVRYTDPAPRKTLAHALVQFERKYGPLRGVTNGTG